MSKFSVNIPLNFEWRGLTIAGAAGATHRIPDALYDEFMTDFVTGKASTLMPGLVWISVDDMTAVGGAHPDLAAHDTLGLALQSELDTHAGAGDPHTAYALDTDLANHEAAGHVHTHVYSTLTSIPATFAPASHSHVDGDLPAGLARDSEVSAAIASHESTATHGGGSGVPAGIIAMWGGFISAIPSGWLLCDGQNGTPDLRSRFIKGAAAGSNPGATGGSTTHTHADHTGVITHTHTVTITDPGHFHDEYRNSATTGGLDGWAVGDTSTSTPLLTGYDTGSKVTGITASAPAPAGAVSALSHDSPNSEPPYYALAYIQKS